ncbi:integrase/recombinase XerC [Thermodesulfitimonas autotrophica]|uniref:Integrase/recombinase XerC n=1 Tax=Thermodesulfitimonas autotrophica TaxID=1894989 RepID=A0A3N5B0N6_9THEO|nr:tyrosine-type recombinase/integrase [Thermodesulfitimonas autotrophica]RPF49200.1 integrase/recombinase XerC [Thermodesulfitimonas autotrophica]
MHNVMDTFTRFRDKLLAKGLSPGTVEVYLGHLRRFFAWVEGTYGETDPAAVTPLDVADYRRHLQNRDRKPATVNNALDAIGSFFAWAKEAGIVQSDPTEGVKRLPEEKSPPKWLSRRELGALVRAVQKHGSKKEQALIALLLHAGLRVSEAISLRAQDVVIRERSGHVMVRYGKGGKCREVPLNATARRILGEYLSGLSGEWLFPGKNGGPMTRRAAEKALAKYGRLAGVEVTPHRLRHTFCKMLVDAGESLDRVAMLAGHSNLNTTARYTRPGKADLEAAVEKIAWE